MIRAVQLVGDLFCSKYELYVWMFLLRGDEFKTRIKAVQYSIMVNTSSNEALRLAYEQTGRVFEVHAHGLELVTIMNCAQLYRADDRFKTDWKNVGLLSAELMQEWCEVVQYITLNLRFVCRIDCCSGRMQANVLIQRAKRI